MKDNNPPVPSNEVIARLDEKLRRLEAACSFPIDRVLKEKILEAERNYREQRDDLMKLYESGEIDAIENFAKFLKVL